MFLNKIRNLFCVPDTKFVSATNVASAGKRGNICVGNNVSSFARALTSSCFFLFFVFGGGGGWVMGRDANLLPNNSRKVPVLKVSMNFT